MKLALSLLIGFVLASPAAAQAPVGRVAGTVGVSTGDPVEGATVVLSTGLDARTAVTGPDGMFRFDGLTAGRYELQASKDGFRGTTSTFDLDAGISLRIDVELQLAYAQTVVVTASRTEQSLISAPASVSVLTSRDIELSAADNMADLLRGVPGLNVMQIGPRDININARTSTGILSNKMLVMVDGRSFFQPIFGAVYWDLLPVHKNEIDQIEVLLTPSSAVWGANALSGVINVQTKSPRQIPGLRGRFGLGEQGTRTLDASWAAATPGVSYKLSGGYFEQDAWERDNLMPDGSPMPPAVQFRNVGTKQPKFDARIDWDGNPERVWQLRGGIAGANGLIFSALGPSEFGSGSYASYLEADYHQRDLDLKLYWNRLDAPFKIVLFGLDEDSTNDTFVGELTRRFAVNRHAISVGGAARFDRFDITIAPLETKRFDLAVFAEDAVTLTPTIKLVMGGRVDKFDTTDAVFAPRLGAVLTPYPQQSFRVTYNRAFRAPSLLENFVDVDLPSVVPLDPPFVYFQSTLGSTDLRMEKLDAFEVGYTGVFGRHTTVSATVYRQSINDNIRFFPVTFYGPGNPPPGWPLPPDLVPPLPHLFTFLNLGKVRDRGIELAATFEWPRLSMQGTYAFQDTPALENESTTFPLQLNRPSKHSAGGRLAYREDRWNASIDINYTGRAFWSDVFTEPFWGYTESYVAVNGQVTVRPRGWPVDVWLSGVNLLDKHIKTHVFSDTARRRISAGIAWSTQ